MATIKENESPVWLRILEISAGLVILILGVAAFYPGVIWGNTTFIAFLAIALMTLEIAYIIRIVAKGMSEQRRLNLALSVLATLIAVLVLALTFYLSPYISLYGVFLALLYLLALGLVFAGIASAARGTLGGKIVGIFGIFVGILVLVFMHIAGILGFFISFAVSAFPDLAYYPELLAALITLSLMIFGLEPMISGIIGT